MNNEKLARGQQIQQLIPKLNESLARWERVTKIESVSGSHTKLNGDRVVEHLSVEHMPFHMIQSMSIIVLKSKIDNLTNEYNAL